MGRGIFWLSCVIGLAGCGAGSDSNETIDPAAIAAAPQATKDICERVCSAADLVRSSGCGSTEFSNHTECYQQCVHRYLTHAKCKQDFDDASRCEIDEGCNYETQCRSEIVFAAACLQSG